MSWALPCRIVADGPVRPSPAGSFAGAFCFKVVPNRSILHMNPVGRKTVLGGDERRAALVMPVAVSDEEPVVS